MGYLKTPNGIFLPLKCISGHYQGFKVGENGHFWVILVHPKSGGKNHQKVTKIMFLVIIYLYQCYQAASFEKIWLTSTTMPTTCSRTSSRNNLASRHHGELILVSSYMIPPLRLIENHHNVSRWTPTPTTMLTIGSRTSSRCNLAPRHHKMFIFFLQI